MKLKKTPKNQNHTSYATTKLQELDALRKLVADMKKDIHDSKLTPMNRPKMQIGQLVSPQIPKVGI